MKRGHDIARLHKKYGGKCCYCGRYTLLYVENGHPQQATREHIVPRSWGGSDDKSNIALACHRCNQARGNKPNHPPMAERKTTP